MLGKWGDNDFLILFYFNLNVNRYIKMKIYGKEKKFRHIASFGEIIGDFSQNKLLNLFSFWKKENTFGRMTSCLFR